MTDSKFNEETPFIPERRVVDPKLWFREPPLISAIRDRGLDYVIFFVGAAAGLGLIFHSLADAPRPPVIATSTPAARFVPTVINYPTVRPTTTSNPAGRP